MRQLRKNTKRLFDEFDKAAQSWGYFSDQGVGEETQQSQTTYEYAKRRLLKKLLDLESPKKVPDGSLSK